MKKLIFSLALLLAVVFPKSSLAVAAPSDNTLVGGTVYNSSNVAVPGSSVSVVCHHNGSDNQLNTTTDSTGSYSVNYTPDMCTLGNAVDVYASHGGNNGHQAGSISMNVPVLRLDVGIVNVFFAVPEYGAMTGAAAVGVSVAAFLFLRRKQQVNA